MLGVSNITNSRIIYKSDPQLNPHFRRTIIFSGLIKSQLSILHSSHFSSQGVSFHELAAVQAMTGRKYTGHPKRRFILRYQRKTK